MITNGISTASLYPMYTEKAIEELGKNNVKSVEIFLNTHSETKKDYALNIKKIIDFYGMTIPSLHPYTCVMDTFMFFTKYDRRFEDAIEYHKRYFEMMNIIGAEIFVFHGNKKEMPIELDFYMDRYHKIVTLGKTFGVTVAQENVSRCTARSLDFLKKMAYELKEDAHFVLDTKQARRSEVSPLEVLETLGDKVCHIHISDGGEKGDCLLIGDGDEDFNLFYKKLKSIGFDKRVMIELYRQDFDGMDDLLKSLAKLDKISQSV